MHIAHTMCNKSINWFTLFALAENVNAIPHWKYIITYTPPSLTAKLIALRLRASILLIHTRPTHTRPTNFPVNGIHNFICSDSINLRRRPHNGFSSRRWAHGPDRFSVFIWRMHKYYCEHTWLILTHIQNDSPTNCRQSSDQKERERKKWISIENGTIPKLVFSKKYYKSQKNVRRNDKKGKRKMMRIRIRWTSKMYRLNLNSRMSSRMAMRKLFLLKCESSVGNVLYSRQRLTKWIEIFFRIKKSFSVR